MPTAQESPIRCHCGAVALHLAAAPRAPINCHCGLCRHLSGSAFTTWVTMKIGEVRAVGENDLTLYHPTENLERLFCKYCGTHILTKDKRHPGVIGIPAGLLENLELPPPKAEYFVSHKASWFKLTGGLPCFGGESGFDAVDA